MSHYLSLSLFILLFFTILSGCSKTLSTQEKDFISADDRNVSMLLKSIEKINSNAPVSFNTDINVDGHSGIKKFKTEGNAQFASDPKKMRIVFHDAIFKSSITEIIQDGDILKIYFPFDKILYIDNIRTVDLKFYTDIDLEYNLISDLSTGRIPVIKNYSVMKGLESKTNNDTDDNKLILLENEKYFETISFSCNIPDKILWVNKSTKEKLEVYLKDPFKKDELCFYRLIKVVSMNSDLNISIQFNSLNLNVPVDLEKIGNIKLPNDAKVINRTLTP